MEKIDKIYILKNSYPDKVCIVSKKNNLDTTFDITSSEMFLKMKDHLLAISKSPEYERVDIFITPPKCRLIWFDRASKVGTGGWINLKKCKEIAFYELESEEVEIFEDLFSKYLSMDNKFIKRALTHHSSPNLYRGYEHNSDMAYAGGILLEFVKSNHLFDFYNDAMVPLQYFTSHILTDDTLCSNIAKKYDLIKYLDCDQSALPADYSPKNAILSDTLKALLFAIYSINLDISEIVEIVREWIFATDTLGPAMPAIRNQYKTLAEYLKKQDPYDVVEFITFAEVEKIIKQPLDYPFFYFTNIFTDFGYRINKVDFENQKIYLDICYL